MKKKCIICGKINIDGIIVEGKKICFHCENKVLNSSLDTDFYVYYKDMIRKNIVPLLINKLVGDKELLKKGE